MAKLSEIEAARLKAIMADPVLWAKAFIVTNNAKTKRKEPWSARDYQMEMLRDPSTRKVYRCGRRCLPSWVTILDPDTGELIEVGELAKRGKAHVVTMDQEEKITTEPNAIVFDNGVKPVYKITTASGREIDATSNHPFYVHGKWVELKDLKVGGDVAIPSSLPYFGSKEDTKEHILSYAERFIDVEIRHVCTLKKELVIEFLKHLYRIHGSYKIEKGGASVSLSHPHKCALSDIMHILLRFGIRSKLVREDTFKLVISGARDIILFRDTVSPALLKERLKDIRTEEPIEIDNGIFYETIVSIKHVGKFPTYDLTVPYTHNFVANDFITHNTGKTETMIIDGLHKACTHVNYRVLYVTPYDNQVNLIFMRMRELISNSPVIKNEVVRMKNSPYMIQFKNGSVILGFTTGASSGSGAASVN